MHKPLEAALTALEQNIEASYTANPETSIPGVQNNIGAQTGADGNLAEIREKIKAARLEKLMARQLASELNEQETAPGATSSNGEEFSRENEALIQSIDETSETLNNFIAEIEEKNEAAKADSEAYGIIESQNKQIELLEFLRSKEAEQTEKLNGAIQQLEKLAQTQSDALEESRAELEKLQEKINTHHEQLLESKRENSEIKEKLLIEQQNSKAYQNQKGEISRQLDDLQEKHSQVVKRNLEQQSEHQERINQLEDDLRKIVGELQSVREQNNTMQQEIDANNRLVVLQDEMITALTMNESETLKI